ncbi:unnamed protein product [Prunus armeniaca]
MDLAVRQGALGLELGREFSVSARGLSRCLVFAKNRSWICILAVVRIGRILGLVSTSLASFLGVFRAVLCSRSNFGAKLRETFGKRWSWAFVKIRQGLRQGESWAPVWQRQCELGPGLVQGFGREGERVLGFSESEKEKKISGEILVVVLRQRRFPANFRGVANKMSESEEASEYVCSKDESSQTEDLVKGLIEARMVVHKGEMAEPSVESGSEAYREMQKKYKVLEASVDRVLALAHTPEVGSSNQTSPSESVGIAVVSASEGVDIRVGVPLGKRNTLTEAKLVELRTDYSVPPYVGLRLPVLRM